MRLAAVARSAPPILAETATPPEVVPVFKRHHAAMASPRKRSTTSVSVVGVVFIFLLGTGLLHGRNVQRAAHCEHEHIG